MDSILTSPHHDSWDDVTRETVTHVQSLIRINTVNPPGNEMAAARYLDTVLRADGIETRSEERRVGKM